MNIEDKIIEQFKTVIEDKKIDFYNDAYLALNYTNPKRVQQIIEGTKINKKIQSAQEILKQSIINKKFQFYYDLKVLQIEDSTDNNIKNHILPNANEYLDNFDLMDDLDGIISKGFLLQKTTYEIIVLSQLMK